MVIIVDCKTGNLGSIQNMLKKIGEKSIISSDPEKLYEVDKIILPGVGSFNKGVRSLKELGLWEPLNKRVLVDKVPILGICLGAQLMTKGSEEGQELGFGWVDAFTYRFKIDRASKFKVPHMGWNKVDILKDSKLMANMFEDARFYFVHSYHMTFNDLEQRLLSSAYTYDFDAAFEEDNIMGVQFHPEKSHKYGMRLLKNFVDNY
uniref:imidazole glycerol phosphate synthase subunit HisH n=1 Tax=Algoriphagus sp. TaxID=1872435 RepID=UPI0040486239